MRQWGISIQIFPSKCFQKDHKVCIVLFWPCPSPVHKKRSHCSIILMCQVCTYPGLAELRREEVFPSVDSQRGRGGELQEHWWALWWEEKVSWKLCIIFGCTYMYRPLAWVRPGSEGDWTGEEEISGGGVLSNVRRWGVCYLWLAWLSVLEPACLTPGLESPWDSQTVAFQV